MNAYTTTAADDKGPDTHETFDDLYSQMVIGAIQQGTLTKDFIKNLVAQCRDQGILTHVNVKNIFLASIAHSTKKARNKQASPKKIPDNKPKKGTLVTKKRRDNTKKRSGKSGRS